MDPPQRTGPSKLSSGVARRVQLSLELEGVLAACSPEIAAAHEELVSEVLAPGERVPDLATSLDCYRRLLAATREALEDADLSHQAVIDEEAELCRERDRRFVLTGKSLSRARRVCLGWLGSRGPELCGLPRTVDHGSAVVKQAREVLRCLHGYQDPPAGPGFEKWAVMLAEEIEPDLRTVETLIATIEKVRQDEGRQAQCRQEAMTTFDQRYLSIGRLAEATLRLSGKTEEADLIHPTTRKLSRKQDADPT